MFWLRVILMYAAYFSCSSCNLVYRDGTLWEWMDTTVHRYPSTGYRPSICCKTCGDSFGLVGDRCIEDKLNSSLDMDSMYTAEIADPFLLNINDCCYFCGSRPNSYSWNQTKGLCVAKNAVRIKDENKTYPQLLCIMCKFLTWFMKNMHPKRAIPTADDRSMCSAFLGLRNECENYMVKHWSKIVSLRC